jgi:hypothetical protein
MSSPTSLMTVCATIASTPSMRVRSTPVMRSSSSARWKCGLFLLCFLFFFGGSASLTGGGVYDLTACSNASEYSTIVRRSSSSKRLFSDLS